jgi:hypothetical protein
MPWGKEEGMNRRDFVNRSAAAVGCLMVPGALWQEADEGRTLIGHVIRLKLSSRLSQSQRERIVATIHRFKQIKSPNKLIVGRDIAQPGTDAYDYAQISLFSEETAYYDYFYDPIHLAADREAATMEFERASAFDTLQGGDEGLPARLEKILAERDARFVKNDTRPVSPPAPDRPEDLRWPEGRTIYRMVRFDLSGLDPERRAEQLAAMGRCREIKGTHVMVAGRNFTRNPADLHTHAMLVALENEQAYREYMAHPVRKEAEGIGGRAGRTKTLAFDVVDPDDTELHERMAKLR